MQIGIYPSRDGQFRCVGVRFTYKGKTMKALIGAVLMTVACCAQAVSAAAPFRPSCWVISGLHGVSFFQDDAYKSTDNKINHPIMLQLNGENSSTGVQGMTTIQVGDFMALSMSMDASSSTIETYAIDPSANVATYTKSRVITGFMSNLSGVTAFVGRAVACSTVFH